MELIVRKRNLFLVVPKLWVTTPRGITKRVPRGVDGLWVSLYGGADRPNLSGAVTIYARS